MSQRKRKAEFGAGELGLAVVIRKEDFEAMLDCPSSLRDRTILRLLYCLGLRSGEVTTIKKNDVNLKAKSIRIFDSKKKEYFILPIDSKTCELLEEYITPYGVNGWLFPSNWKKGSPLTVRRIQKIIKKYAHQLGLSDGFVPRWFRYRMARNWIDRRGSLSGLQQILRHKNITMTARYVDSIRFEDELRKEYDFVMED